VAPDLAKIGINNWLVFNFSYEKVAQASGETSLDKTSGVKLFESKTVKINHNYLIKFKDCRT